MKKLKRNGFTFIETIVTIVVLSTALLLLYNSYSSIITNEERRLYYDDPAYLYKTYFVKQFLIAHTNIDTIRTNDFIANDKYVLTIGHGYPNMCEDSAYCTSLQNIYNNLFINQILLVDSSLFFNCDFTDSDSVKCKNSLNNNLSTGMRNYLKSLNSIDYDYYLVIEYSSAIITEVEDGNTISRACEQGYGMDDNCKTFYAAVGI